MLGGKSLLFFLTDVIGFGGSSLVEQCVSLSGFLRKLKGMVLGLRAQIESIALSGNKTACSPFMESYQPRTVSVPRNPVSVVILVALY